jgi:hypothetical protein
MNSLKIKLSVQHYFQEILTIFQFIDNGNNLVINCQENWKVYFRRENIRKGIVRQKS